MLKILKRTTITLLVVFVLFNLLLIVQSYGFTHFEPAGTKIDIESTSEKLKMLVTGIKIPRPISEILPAAHYKDVVIVVDENKELHGWYIPTDSVRKGTVLLFHGYVDDKSGLLPEAEEFRKLGYNTILIDFMGSGESYGNQTTMGYLEGENVYATYKYATETLKEDNILLFGFSMGAAAITKAQSDHQMNVKGIILQAAYATYEGTIGSRANRLGLPEAIITKPITFWIGRINGFDGFEANPIDFAEQIEVPALIICGSKDQNIPKEETESIYTAIGSSNKSIQLFEDAHHESLLLNDPELWHKTIIHFLASIE